MTRGEILVADDDASIRTVVAQALSRAGYEVRTTGAAATLWRWVQSGEGDLVVTDVVMPDENAFELLPRIKKLRPELPIIVMSAQNTFMTAIRASERGAYDYLPKPFDLKELVGIVGRAMAEPRKHPEDNGHEEIEGMPLVGRSQAMQEIYRSLARLMQTDLTVMINGETGTGKELAARMLHRLSPRARGPFRRASIARRFPSDLVESELFGHEKAPSRAPRSSSGGRFELADGGTLFLDEIGDMPARRRRSCCEFGEQVDFVGRGDALLIKSNVRVIAATHQESRSGHPAATLPRGSVLPASVVRVALPPLRERGEDVIPARAPLPDAVRRRVSQAAADDLRARTPRSCCDRIAGRATSASLRISSAGSPPCIRRKSFPTSSLRRSSNMRFRQAEPEKTASSAASQELSDGQTLSTSVELHLAKLFRDYGDQLPPPGLYHRIIREIEIPLVSAALAATRGNQIKAAELLGLNRNTLRKKVNDLDIRLMRSPR